MRAILMFHGVDDSGSVLSVTAGQLRGLVEAIRASGLPIVPLRTLIESESAGVALTFDDGFASVLSGAAPVLDALEAPATLFVTTGYVGCDNGWPSQPAGAPRFPVLGWDDLARLKEKGWDVQAHSVCHPDLRRLGDEALQEELQAPRRALAERLGVQADILAYPYGYFDARVARAAGAHYRHAVTTVFRPLAPGDDDHRLPRLDAYYLRDPLVHNLVRRGPRFLRPYLAARAGLRRLRHHPGEIRA